MEVEPRRVQAVQIKIEPASTSNLPLSGVLSLHTDTPAAQSSTSGLRELRLVGAPGGWVNVTTLGMALVLSALGVISCWRRMRRHDLKLSRRMGGASWSFGGSWASNLAVGATAVNAFLSLTALPDQTHYLPRSGYSTTSFLCLLMVTAAPFLYSLVLEISLVVNPLGVTSQQNQGYVGFFLLAAFFTLWGTLGQLITAMFLCFELQYSRLLPDLGASALMLLLVLLCLLVLAYGIRATYEVVSIYSVAPHPRLTPTPELVGKRADTLRVEDLPHPPAALPDWSLL